MTDIVARLRTVKVSRAATQASPMKAGRRRRLTALRSLRRHYARLQPSATA